MYMYVLFMYISWHVPLYDQNNDVRATLQGVQPCAFVLRLWDTL